MTRGRRKDLTIPPSRALLQQRDYRARKAQYVADVEERCRKFETENIELRKEVDDLKRRLSQAPVGPSGVNPELARASSDLMQQLTAAASSLARFQQTAFSVTESIAQNVDRAPPPSPTPLPPASSLLSLSTLPGLSPPPALRQSQSHSPPSQRATLQTSQMLTLPRIQNPHSFLPSDRFSLLNNRRAPADHQTYTPPENHTILPTIPTGRRYTDPPPPPLHLHPSHHQSARQSHHAQSQTHTTPPSRMASVPKLTPSRWDELESPECCAGYFDCKDIAEDSDHDRCDYDEDDDMDAPSASGSSASSASRGSQVVPPTSDVRSMKE